MIDCSRLYYYDHENNVYNSDLQIIGKRMLDDCCPRLHTNNEYTDKCWCYVEYIK